jgi:hypothetical protein
VFRPQDGGCHPKRFIVTFFVIATKKVTKEKSRQTRSLRAFCLASATLLGSVILSESEGSLHGEGFKK